MTNKAKAILIGGALALGGGALGVKMLDVYYAEQAARSDADAEAPPAPEPTPPATSDAPPREPTAP